MQKALMKPSLSLIALGMSASLFGAVGDRMERSKYQCHGAEPFWGLEITDRFLNLTHVSGNKSSFYIDTRTSFAGYTADFAEGFTGFSSTKDRITASIIKKSCSDSMSSIDYDYQVTVQWADTFYYGCCGGGTYTE